MSEPISTEIYVPLSLNRQMLTQLRLLLASIARRADLPGPWRVIVTVSRDTELGLDTPLLDWARGLPVEFRWVDEALWRRFHFNGTGAQQLLYRHEADVGLYMDADTLVTGSLRQLVEETAALGSFGAWPAWQPPPDGVLDRVLEALGVVPGDCGFDYSGYALAFMSPKACPAYFNCGVVALPRAIACSMETTFLPDFEAVTALYDGWFKGQITMTVNLLRQGYPFRPLDMRYNLSNADWDDTPEISGPAVDIALAAARASAGDVRVLHYGTPTRTFVRERDMDGLDRVNAFCALQGVNSGSLRLQQALRPLLAELNA